MMNATSLKLAKKKTGSFYSPSGLAYYVASKISQLISRPTAKVRVLDPAVGDGILLLAMSETIDDDANISYYGIDIDDNALKQTSIFLHEANLQGHLYNADFIRWNQDSSFNGSKSSEGEELTVIISNPPWGAEHDKYNDLLNQLCTATGQYDIYDLFLEKSLNILNNGDLFGFILPDSIFRKEHYPIRKKLLTETSIKYIVRIGEFIFDGVNTPVSFIIGIKGYSTQNLILCANLPNSYTKKIANGTANFGDNESSYFHECPQDSFIESNYSLSIDIKEDDSSIFSKLSCVSKIRDFLSITRGVELSKKGYVICCPNCSKWLPLPKSEQVTCPHCGEYFKSSSALSSQIIIDVSSPKQEGCAEVRSFLAGEDMQRYSYIASKKIILGHEGVNYKSDSLYCSPKILVRKTGVGITAVLDYNNCYVNQVVYVLKNKTKIQNGETDIPLEFFIGLLNTRIVTYYILKKYGASKWVSHPYLSQQMVGEIPVPKIDMSSEHDRQSVNRIKRIVNDTYTKWNGIIPATLDVEVESIFLKLFGLNHLEFSSIYDAIDNAEKLMPFKRLLNIPKGVWDTDI